MLPRALPQQPTSHIQEADFTTRRGQRMAIGKEENSYSLLIRACGAIMRLLLVNGKLLEVVQRYLVQCFLVRSVEEDPVCN
jgi:hypothetical protein